ncbi:ATP-binding protein [Streptomyces sp. NPDC014986]|uniref:ATP-binding protein n=1 Tax=Streptomyces sp. NPDC014986 TaxID=3364934 RepID=UPI0037002E91
MVLTSPPRGARPARLFVAHCLESWGHPCTSDANETLTLITAELCANAVQHGRAPGRDFHVRPAAEEDGGRMSRSVLVPWSPQRRPGGKQPTTADDLLGKLPVAAGSPGRRGRTTHGVGRVGTAQAGSRSAARARYADAAQPASAG